MLCIGRGPRGHYVIRWSVHPPLSYILLSPPSSSLPELPDTWTDSRDALLEGVTFHLKYLGMTLVEKPKGEDMAAAAIRRIITMVTVCMDRADPTING